MTPIAVERRWVRVVVGASHIPVAYAAGPDRGFPRVNPVPSLCREVVTSRPHILPVTVRNGPV